MEDCKCIFKEKCYFYKQDGCKIIPSEYKICYEFMKFDMEEQNNQYEQHGM